MNWELMDETDAVGVHETIHRAEVPGGWLYRCHRVNGHRALGVQQHHTTALCFVPDFSFGQMAVKIPDEPVAPRRGRRSLTVVTDFTGETVPNPDGDAA